jgi:hypothetical protein
MMAPAMQLEVSVSFGRLLRRAGTAYTHEKPPSVPLVPDQRTACGATLNPDEPRVLQRAFGCVVALRHLLKLSDRTGTPRCLLSPRL